MPEQDSNDTKEPASTLEAPSIEEMRQAIQTIKAFSDYCRENPNTKPDRAMGDGYMLVYDEGILDTTREGLLGMLFACKPGVYETFFIHQATSSPELLAGAIQYIQEQRMIESKKIIKSN
ncbi:MAG: hypothetical protein ACPG5W_12260 [Flavobacteriales bacterium]